jgi:hypothetical protein
VTGKSRKEGREKRRRITAAGRYQSNEFVNPVWPQRARRKEGVLAEIYCMPIGGGSNSHLLSHSFFTILKVHIIFSICNLE